MKTQSVEKKKQQQVSKLVASKKNHLNKNSTSNKNKTSSKNKSNSASTNSNLKLLPKQLVLKMHDLMVKSRVLEERLIKIYKAGESYFWIGAPGEEAWGVPLGLHVKKGEGPAYDYLHLHYRGTPTLIAMGMEMIDSIRMMMNRSTDPCTGGRNFSNHYCFPKWNVAPVSSPIEVQYIIAMGTAHVQKRTPNGGLTIVTGGDAGTAEGDFASSLIWSSRKGQELPMLITVQNNRWGISTSFEGQHGETHIADRAKAFNIRARVINGNDPIESYIAVQEEMNYIRKNKKPSFIEAKVSRLYGHSSASGANFVSEEQDPVKNFEHLLLKSDYIKESEVKQIWSNYEKEGFDAQQVVRSEPSPTSDTIWDHVFVKNENSDWRKF